MHHRDVVIGIGPIRMRRADIDIRLRRHAGMADAVRAPEAAEPVLLRHLGGVAEILDQLERAAEGQHLRALDLLDVRGEPPRVAGIAQAITEGIGRGFGDLDGLGADLGEHPVDLGLPLPDLLADVVVLGHVLLLGELEAHDIFVGRRRPIDGEARGVGTAMLEALQHRRHLLADAGRAVTVDEAGNSAHVPVLLPSPYRFARPVTAGSRDRSWCPIRSRWP